ncbi:MAG: S-layer homology domain-containing protein [Candidatus Desulforudis sp.]|nr:S-layer homology domain-containing protein [Desulforudis sp.]
MRKKLLVLVVSLALILALAGLAQAEEITADGLTALLPGQSADEPLTRSGFALLLNAAADIAPAADAAASAEVLINEGIMKGYPDGSMGIDEPVTRAQAAAFIARTLGLPEAVDPGAISGLEGLEGHWAYRPLAWMAREDLLDADAPDSRLTVGEGAALLAHVFGPVAEGRELNAQSQIALQDVRSMRMQGTFDMEMRLREAADLEVPAELADLRMHGKLSTAINLDQGMYQVSTVTVPGLPAEVETEQYFTPDGVFMKTADPMTGEGAWQRMPEGLFPDITAILEQSMGQAVPPELDKMFYYRYLGEEQLDGRAVYKMATYGQIKDFEEMMSVLESQLGGSFQDMLAPDGMPVGQILQSMNIIGVGYLDQETLAPVRMEMLLTVDLAEEILGQPNPFAGMTMNCSFTYSDFGGEIVIEVPEEALNAPVLEIPVPELEVEEPPEPAVEEEPAEEEPVVGEPAFDEPDDDEDSEDESLEVIVETEG